MPGPGDESFVDQREWKRAWRTALEASPTESGPRMLCHALAEHLGFFRGIEVEPDQVVLRPSVSSTVDELVHGLGLVGRGIALEDPGQPRLPGYLAKAGCRVHCVPVDSEGLRVDLLSPDAAAVHVTPARQWPTGAVLSPERRQQLFDWSRDTGGVILENDYDAEFTYGHVPPPTLKATAPPGVEVIYLGSSAKLVSKDLQVVWMVVPDRFRRRAWDTAPVSEFPARTLAALIDSGALYRHHNRALRLYDERRTALIHQLQQQVPEVRVAGDQAGTELVLALPEGCDELRVQMLIEDAGFRVSAIGDFAMRQQSPALLLQYGELPSAIATEFADVLKEALAS